MEKPEFHEFQSKFPTFFIKILRILAILHKKGELGCAKIP